VTEQKIGKENTFTTANAPQHHTYINQSLNDLDKDNEKLPKTITFNPNLEGFGLNESMQRIPVINLRNKSLMPGKSNEAGKLASQTMVRVMLDTESDLIPRELVNFDIHDIEMIEVGDKGKSLTLKESEGVFDINTMNVNKEKNVKRRGFLQLSLPNIAEKLDLEVPG